MLKKLSVILIAMLTVASLSFAQSKVTKLTEEDLKTIKFLNDSELKELFNGTTIKGYSYKRDKNFMFTFNEDGTVTHKNKKGKEIKRKWSIKDGQKCIEGKKKTHCRRHYTDGQKYYNVTQKKQSNC